METIDITAQVIERARKVRERLLQSETVVAIPAEANRSGQAEQNGQ